MRRPALTGLRPWAYYNEIDAEAAQGLRELIAMGEIAPGEVDERSIEHVKPEDLDGFTQCHFFAGIGVWSAALIRAGWANDFPVWTGSCPCQGFSIAGRGRGFDDDRHLWPVWFDLIKTRRPGVILGEQVASSLILGPANAVALDAAANVPPPSGAEPTTWIDLVQTDMEGARYTSIPFDLPAAGFGAPNIRQRVFFGAYADELATAPPSVASRARLEGYLRHGDGRQEPGWDGAEPPRPASACGFPHVLADHNGGRLGRREITQEGRDHDRTAAERQEVQHGPVGDGEAGDAAQRPGPTNGFWRDADWLLCQDEQWRPIEPGNVPLVDGSAAVVGCSLDTGLPEPSPEARKGRLKGYGNAINREVATEAIESFTYALDVMHGDWRNGAISLAESVTILAN